MKKTADGRLTVELLKKAYEEFCKPEEFKAFTAKCGHEVSGEPYSYYFVEPSNLLCESCAHKWYSDTAEKLFGSKK